MPNSTINATTNGLNSTAGNVATLDLQVAGSTVASVGSTGISVTGTVSATGVSSFPAGSNTAPSITFTGDTNTGIYSPAADTIAFTEGGVEAMRLDSSGNVLVGTTSASTPSSTGFISTANTFGFKNRIINGGMQIDQRNAGAAITTNGYSVDRFDYANFTDGAFSVQQDTSAPAGFIRSLKVTVTTADSSVTTNQSAFISQKIEGLNVSDLGWGAAGAKTVTLSFWVRSSLTGTFGGSFRNNATDRSYPFTYSISAANTWEQKTVTVAGDTTGTWLTTNGVGINLSFSLAAGPSVVGTASTWAAANYVSASSTTNVVSTLNATWFITGVQLEVGTAATSFDVRDYGRELFLCQRYFWKIKGSDGAFACFSSGVTLLTTQARHWISFPASMRSAPTITYGGNIYSYDGTNLTVTSISVLPGLTGALIDFTGSGGGGNVGRGAVGYPAGASTDFIQAAIEL